MGQIGMFNGLWGGISNTLGLGAAEISELTGSADKKRAQELALQQLNAQESVALASQKTKTYIIIATIVLFIIIGAMASRR